MSRSLLSSRLARTAASAIQAQFEPQRLENMRDLAASLEDGRLALVDESCPCGATSDVIVAEVDRYGLPLTTVLCETCGALRTNPYLSPASLDEFYRTSYQSLYARAPVLADYFSRQGSYGRRVLALYEHELGESANVLEVGCGAGGGLAPFQERGHRVAGCELSADLIAFGQAQGIADLWHGDMSDAPRRLGKRRFELVVLHHVFEHMSSPEATLKQLRQWLTPEGRILVIVPDVTRIDRFCNPAGDVLKFLHIAHKFNFTTDCLETVAPRAALQALSCTPPAHLSTAWSEMPELWMEFRPTAAAATAPSPRLGVKGRRVLEYLVETERRHLAGELQNPRLGDGIQPPPSQHEPRRLGWIKRWFGSKQSKSAAA